MFLLTQVRKALSKMWKVRLYLLHVMARLIQKHQSAIRRNVLLKIVQAIALNVVKVENGVGDFVAANAD